MGSNKLTLDLVKATIPHGSSYDLLKTHHEWFSTASKNNQVDIVEYFYEVFGSDNIEKFFCNPMIDTIFGIFMEGPSLTRILRTTMENNAVDVLKIFIREYNMDKNPSNLIKGAITATDDLDILKYVFDTYTIPPLKPSMEFDDANEQDELISIIIDNNRVNSLVYLVEKSYIEVNSIDFDQTKKIVKKLIYDWVDVNLVRKAIEILPISNELKFKNSFFKKLTRDYRKEVINMLNEVLYYEIDSSSGSSDSSDSSDSSY